MRRPTDHPHSPVGPTVAGQDWIDNLTQSDLRKLFSRLHDSAGDTDSEKASIHHTLGVRPTQAAYGDHTHEFDIPGVVVDMAPQLWTGAPWLQSTGGLTPPTGISQEWWLLPSLKIFSGWVKATYQGATQVAGSDGNINNTILLQWTPPALGASEGWDIVCDVAGASGEIGKNCAGYLDAVDNVLYVTATPPSSDLVAGTNLSFYFMGFYTDYVGALEPWSPDDSTGTGRPVGRRR